jgi:adenylyltransferase/sulfurtransferase
MVPEINVRQLAARLQAGEKTFLLDVRQPWEHETAALPDSCLVPLDQLSTRASELDVPPNALLVVYCHHGIRSQSAVALLRHLGREAVSLAGGIDAWSLLVDPRVPRY